MESKTHWSQFIRIPFLSILTLILFPLFIFFCLDAKPKPFGAYMFPAILLFFCLGFLLFYVFNLKRLEVTDDGLNIVYPASRKKIRLKWSEVENYSEEIHHDRYFGDYYSCFVKIKDGKSIVFTSREFSNYSLLLNL